MDSPAGHFPEKPALIGGLAVKLTHSQDHLFSFLSLSINFPIPAHIDLNPIYTTEGILDPTVKTFQFLLSCWFEHLIIISATNFLKMRVSVLERYSRF